MRLSLIIIGPCFGTSFGPSFKGSSFGPRFGHYNTNWKNGGQNWSQNWVPNLDPKVEPLSQNCSRIFFGHAANRCPQWSCPCCNFRLFSCSRASLHAFCDSQLKRSSQLLEKERAQAWVSPICAPSNNCCSRNPNCARSNKPYNVQEFDAAVYRNSFTNSPKTQLPENLPKQVLYKLETTKLLQLSAKHFQASKTPNKTAKAQTRSKVPLPSYTSG